MEERHSQEFHSWLQAQAAYTRIYLDALPAHVALLRRIAELETTSPEIDSFRLATGRIFYEIREPGEAVRKLAMHLAPGTGCPTAFCKGNRSDIYLDEIGGIGIVIRVAGQPLFSVSHFPSRAGGFEKLFKVTWNMEYSIRNINYVDFALIHWRSYEEESAYST